jgi:uncharacterized membrane protein
MAPFLLGLSSGLRTFTAPAVLFIFLNNHVAGTILAVLALAEYVGDQLPKAPPRTSPPSLAFRIASGAVVGWFSFPMPHVVGSLIAIVGVLIGAFGGLRVRLWAMKHIGGVAAGLIEDVIAIVLAVGGMKLTMR